MVCSLQQKNEESDTWTKGSCADFKSEVHLDSVYISLVNVVQWKETKKEEGEEIEASYQHI